MSPGWRTARPSHRVLLVVHSVTAAARIADVLPALHDRRVQLFCTQTSGAVFSAGVADFLRDAGALVLPWADAVRERFDVAITASLGDDLHELNSPILRIPHGNGYNKYWKNGESGNPGIRDSGVFGLSEETLTHEGRIVPDAIALSHTEQLARLEKGCPEALPRAFVAGDPCHDRILASLPRRRAYRRAFGLRPGRRLVVVNSTWREDSLFGSHPEFVERILAELPFDEFAVALVLHPNVWYGHSELQIRTWLDRARAAGLILVPPDEGWRAAVVAADHVVSDHGSVGVYAAAIGAPVLLAAEGRESVDPASGLGRLMRAAAVLDPAAPLRPQLERSAELRERTEAVAAEWVSSAPGRSLSLIREAAYRFLGLAPPEAEPVLRAVPEPEPPTGPSPSLRVFAGTVDGDPRRLRVRRLPEAVLHGLRHAAAGGDLGVLVASEAEPDHRLASTADVIRLSCDDPAGGRDDAGAAWSADVFADRPGAALTMAHDGRRAVLRPRTGEAAEVVLEQALHPLDAELFFSVLAERAVRGETGTLAAHLASLSPLTLHAGADRTLSAKFAASPAPGGP